MKVSRFKRQTVYVLALALIFTSVFAGNFSYAETIEDITIKGLDYSSGKLPTENKTYKAGDGSIAYDVSSKTLTLENATVNITEKPDTGEAVLDLSDNNDLKIVLKGKNLITVGVKDIHALKSRGIEIKGDGELDLTLTDKGTTANVINAEALVVSESAHIYVTKEGGYGIDVPSAVHVNSLELKDSAKFTVKDGILSSYQTLELGKDTELNAKIVVYGDEFITAGGKCNFIARKKGIYTVYGNVALNGKLISLNSFSNDDHKIIVPQDATLEFEGADTQDVPNFSIENRGTISFVNDAEFKNSGDLDFTITNNGNINVAKGKKVTFDLKKLPTMEGNGKFINKGTVEFKVTELSNQVSNVQEEINLIKNFVKNDENGIIKIDQSGEKTLIATEDLELYYAKRTDAGINLTNQNKRIKFIPDDQASVAVEEGDAYILYDPASKKLILKNICYRTTQITLPNDKITVNIVGKNMLYNKEADIPIFKQGDDLNQKFEDYLKNGKNPEFNADRGIVFTGTGFLNIFSKESLNAKSIETDGYLTINGGRIYKNIQEANEFEKRKFTNPIVNDGVFGITCALYSQNGGDVVINSKMPNVLHTFGFTMTNGKFLTTKDSSTISVYGDLTVTGGEFKPSFSEGHILVMGDVKNYSVNDGLMVAKINFNQSSQPPVSVKDLPKYSYILYGTPEMATYDENGKKNFITGEDGIILLGYAERAFVTLESGNNAALNIKTNQSVACALYADFTTAGGSKEVISVEKVVAPNTQIVNNGKFLMQVEPLEKADLDKKVKEIATYLKMQGNGTIEVATADNPVEFYYYGNDGTPKNTVDGSFNLNFSENTNDRETASKGLSWKRDDATDSYILTLNGVYLEKTKNITLPTDKKVTIKLDGISQIDGAIASEGADVLQLELTGNGTLITKGLPTGGINGDTITIVDGVKVYVKDKVSFGGSGGEDGILNVKGKGTLLDIDVTSLKVHIFEI